MGFSLFSFNRTERSSCTTHSEILLEAIKGGKCHRTERFFSVVGLERCCVEREGVKPLFRMFLTSLMCQIYCPVHSLLPYAAVAAFLFLSLLSLNETPRFSSSYFSLQFMKGFLSRVLCKCWLHSV